MRAWDRYWYGPTLAVRPWLLTRGVLWLLALDAWLVMVSHGGRYGVGGFNVAHFTWLDAIQPVPSAGFYVGIVLFSGLLAFVLAGAGGHRLGYALLTVVYTYGWAMSMLDSYQHHYLISILLACFVALPPLGAKSAVGEPARGEVGKANRKRSKRKGPTPFRMPRVSAWAYPLLCVSIAIVYGYTAIAKTETDWRMGAALQRIAPADRMEPIRAYFVDAWGMPAETFWALVGHSVVFVQVVIAAAYLAAPLRDRGDRAMNVLCWVGFVAALSFHAGAEYLRLRIGWFSWYMVWVACVCLLPGTWVWWLARGVSAPVRALARQWDEWTRDGGFGAAIPAALGAMGVLLLVGWKVDLPGSFGAGAAAGGFLALLGAWLVGQRRSRETARWIVATLAAGLAMWGSIAMSDVRFDYYRYVGGDARRRGEYEAALEAYVKANRYAPDDDDRKEKEEEMRRRLGR